MEILQACPFCGSIPNVDCLNHEMWWVECTTCGATTIMVPSEKDAVDFWNAGAKAVGKQTT